MGAAFKKAQGFLIAGLDWKAGGQSRRLSGVTPIRAATVRERLPRRVSDKRSLTVAALMENVLITFGGQQAHGELPYGCGSVDHYEVRLCLFIARSRRKQARW
jgi:hypothetical protein